MSVQDLTQDAATEAVATASASHTDGISCEEAPTSQDAEAGAWNEHAVNLRITILGRYHVTIAAGKERRSLARRNAERQKHPLNTLGNTLATLAFSVAIGLALYGLQMTLGLWALERFILAP